MVSKDRIILKILALVALIMADGLITEAIIAAGYGVEANQYLAPLINAGLMLAFKAAGAAIAAGLIALWYQSKPSIAAFALNTGLILYGALFTWNTAIYYLGEAIS